MQLFIYSLVSLLGVVYSAGGGSRGKWQVINPNSNIACIQLYGQIDLDLTYYIANGESAKDGHITVPGSSTVNSKQSSCSLSRKIGNATVESQMMQIDLYHMQGWNIQFYFSTDKRFQTNGNEWTLYQVIITANYSSDPLDFPNPSVPTVIYTSPIDLGGSTDLADSVFAHLQDSLYCPSKQKYIVNDDTKQGPRATMTFSLLQIQAYMTTEYVGMAPFGNKETCPTDQHVTDKVPIIVGSCLAGLIVFTMVAYLIYRSCLPPEVIHLVNPGSHENKAMSIDEEEDEESGHTGH